MFYSHDLLGRKTPLGAIWTLAHGRRLSKGKIISINLREICQEMLQPGVPHSLRLQGILIGGLVIVYNKQQAYLLEDLQEMMRKVKAAGKGGSSSGGDAAAASTAADRNTLRKGRNQAKLESITLLDMEDLLAPVGDGMGMAGADDYFLLDAASSGMNFSLNPSSSEGGSRASKRSRTTAGDEKVADGLFIMPSLPAEAPALSDLTNTHDQRAKQTHSRSHGVSWAADTDSKGRTEELQQHEDVYGGLAHGMGAWPQEDEMFDINVDLDLLGGMDIGGPHPTAPAEPAGTATSEQFSKLHSTSAAPVSTDLAGGRDPTLLPSGDQYISETEFNQQFDQVDHDFDQLPTLDPTPAAPSENRGDSQPAAEQDKEEQHHTAEGPTPAVAISKSKKRKASMLIIDDLDDLQIRSKVYREWVTDHTRLVNRSLLKGTVAARSILRTRLASSGLSGLDSLTLAAPRSSVSGPSGLHDPATLLADPTALYAHLGLGTGAGGAGLCGELQELFREPVEAAAAEQKRLARKRLQPTSPEVNNSTDVGLIHQRRERPANANFNQLHLTRTDPLTEGDEEHSVRGGDMLDPGLMVMPEIEEELYQPREQQHEALSNDEAHDQLMDLPFADGEVERLRAAGPGSIDSGSLQFTSPRSAAAALAARGAKHAGSDASGSSMMQEMPYDGPDVDFAGMAGGLRRALSMSDVEGGEGLQGGMFFGAGRLDDLLPDIPLPELEPMNEEQEHQQQFSEPSEKSSKEPSPSLLPNSSQYPLVEETEGNEATQALQQQAAVATHASRKVLSIFCERLTRKEAEADETQDSQALEAPSVSLFGLMKEGRLSRSAAATLFYQVCVTSSAGYITASQDRAFGDVIIKAGRNMPWQLDMQHRAFHTAQTL